MGVLYDPSAGIFRTALRVRNTIIPMVIDGPEFWLLLLFNSVVCFTRHLNYIDPEAYHLDLPWGLTGVTGSLMTFFVCFYNSNVFARYTRLYELTQQMSEYALELMALLRVQVDNLNLQRKVCKFVTASCFMFFFERSMPKDNHDEDDCESVLSEVEIEQIVALELLEEAEITALRRYCKLTGKDALPSLLLVIWAMELIRLKTPEASSRDDMLCGIYSKFYGIRACQAQVVQILNSPMPFQYFHIMNLMLMLNLLLWAYSLGCMDSLWAPFIYMCVQMMFQGIRELSTALSDPFGDDDVDFPINDWMHTMYKRLHYIIEDNFDVRRLSLAHVTPLKDPNCTESSIDMCVDVDSGASVRRRMQKRSSSRHEGRKVNKTRRRADERRLRRGEAGERRLAAGESPYHALPVYDPDSPPPLEDSLFLNGA